LQAADEGWQEFFNRNGIAPLRVSYEERLEPDAEGAVRAVLDYIGVQPPPGWRPRVKLRRQADALSDEWVTAYHRDAAVRRGRSSPAPVAGR
jgi:LPS sulfotransferase NodH